MFLKIIPIAPFIRHHGNADAHSDGQGGGDIEFLFSHRSLQTPGSGNRIVKRIKILLPMPKK